MVKYIAGLPLESVVDITGVVTLPLQPVEKATQKMIEIQINTFHCISKASPQMPFLIEDASRTDFKVQPAFGTYNAEEDTNEEGKASADGLIRVGQEIRLDHWWIDLRTPANQAIFRIESMVGTLFREYLTNNGQRDRGSLHYCKLKPSIIVYLLLLTVIGIQMPGTVSAENLRSNKNDRSSNHQLSSPADLNNPKMISTTSKSSNSLQSNETKLTGRRLLLQNIVAFQDFKSVQFKRDHYPLTMQETEHNYDDIYLSNGAHESYNDYRILDFTTFTTYLNDEVIQKGCSLSTVLMDPRMTVVDSQHPMWYSLESVATYAPYSCVVLQTASCLLLEAGKSFTNKTEEIEAVARVIYAQSLPMFRRMMERGQVRITVLNPVKYHFGRCDNFNPSFAMVNLHYWRDEFIENVDSDNVLVIQDDAVLCHYFDIDRWTDLAWAGSVWQPGLCGIMGWWENYRPNCIATQKHKDWVLHPRLEICKDGYGPNGNGGLSLRKRSWLIRAIEACPWTTYGGIESNEYKMIDQGLPEDQYFAVILNAMNAPFPSVLEASLLFAETQFLEDAEKFYGTFPNEQLESAVINRWGEKGLSMYERMHEIETYDKFASKPTLSKFEKYNITGELSQEVLRTIPIGLHKPWRYQTMNILLGKQVEYECKFFKFILNPDN